MGGQFFDFMGGQFFDFMGGQFFDFMGGQFFDFMGGHSCYEGDIELMGGPPVPPLGKTLILP